MLRPAGCCQLHSLPFIAHVMAYSAQLHAVARSELVCLYADGAAGRPLVTLLLATLHAICIVMVLAWCLYPAGRLDKCTGTAPIHRSIFCPSGVSAPKAIPNGTFICCYNVHISGSHDISLAICQHAKFCA